MSAGRILRTVELVQAFAWTCDDCGRDNFERAITVSPESIDPRDLVADSPEDAEAIEEWIASGGSGDWVRPPDQVRCKHCGTEFGTESA